MSGKGEIPLETKARQRRASDPAGSAWVSANAGSGKTWVLSRRVIRLLLAGSPASKLLCLTYTKAAAATMSNRVFDELGRWAVLDDVELSREIESIEGVAPRPHQLAKARKLFAEAIETPGGLKIQTIHAFCEAILHQFPLEADLPGSFEVLDDAGKADLIAAAKTRTLLAATSGPATSDLSRAFADIIEARGEFGLNEALDAVIGSRDAYLAWLREAGSLEDALQQLADLLGLQPGDTAERIRAEMLVSPDFPAAFLADLATALGRGGVNDVKQAQRLAVYRSTAADVERLAAWSDFLFTQGGKPRAAASFASKAVTLAFPDLADRFGREVKRIEDLQDRLNALDTHAFTAAVLRLGDAVIGDYEREKRARGALDFDDLIQRTVDLLDRSDSAAWVQFKLDKGIDHILVDEAQDTSARMWTIVERLSEEFFAGLGQRADNRTLFAVGDEKQSIYSFQGAAPDQFSTMRRQFAERARDGQAGFEDIKLTLSFRSTPDVLAAVDTVFAAGRRGGIVAMESDYEDHMALRSGAPGHVEIWPIVKAEKLIAPDDWTAPLDRATAGSPVLMLANRIADEIATLLSGMRLEGTGKRLRPRDILILVRKRDAFVAAINRVLKDRGLAVAGADRLVLTDHIAVEDLVALGRVMLLAEDDLSLAAVLKSPLFGWNDEQLFEVAFGRDGTLWAALSARAATDPSARLASEQLQEWRARVDQMPVYEFYARILGADGGRRRFIARLGAEADDVLDEFLAHALAQEQAGAAGLAGFLAGLEAAAPTIKREMDEARDEIRVMTVHGSKGLEAAVVFLVDSGSAPVSAQHDPKLVPLPIAGLEQARVAALAFVGPAATRPRPVQAAIDGKRQLAGEEYRRLLYVAMTRAADGLYVAGYAGRSGPSPECWHQVIEASLVASGRAIPRLDAEGAVTAQVWRATDLPPVAAVDEPEQPETVADAAAWLDQVPPGARAPRRLTPSTALDELAGKEAPERFPAAAALTAMRQPQNLELTRGTLIHTLLERLPDLDPAERAAAAAAYVARAGAMLDPARRAAIVAEAMDVIDDARFSHLFGPQSRAEVPIIGQLTTSTGETLTASGQIDRLAVGDDEVMILDYKTNREPPEGEDGIPAAYVTQMALYRRLLTQVFPGRTVRALILWTALPAIVEIPADALDRAAAALAIL